MYTSEFPPWDYSPRNVPGLKPEMDALVRTMPHREAILIRPAHLPLSVTRGSNLENGGLGVEPNPCP